MRLSELRGLVFLIAKKVLGWYSDPELLARRLRVKEIVKGRIASISLPTSPTLMQLDIINVHIEAKLPACDSRYVPAKLHLVGLLFGAMAPMTTATTLVGGEWNAAEACGPRFHPLENKFSHVSSTLAKMLSDAGGNEDMIRCATR